MTFHDIYIPNGKSTRECWDSLFCTFSHLWKCAWILGQFCNPNPLSCFNLGCKPKIKIVTQHICDDLNNNTSLLVSTYFILVLFIAYLKQYKISFNIPFQHLKSTVSLCKQFWWIIFTQNFPYNYCFFYSVLFPYLNGIYGQNTIRFIRNSKHNIYRTKTHVFSSNLHLSILKIEHINNR